MYHGEYTLQETVILTQLNLNMQARDIERMQILLVELRFRGWFYSRLHPPTTVICIIGLQWSKDV